MTTILLPVPLLILTIFVSAFCLISCENFILDNVKVFTGAGDNYFGYSILLQSNRTKNRLVVGALKEYQNVYQCDPEGTKCKAYQMLTNQDVEKNRQYQFATGLGQTLDGVKDDIGTYISCAPRKLFAKGSYTFGVCLEYAEQITIYPFSIGEGERGDIHSIGGTSFYSRAFQEAGFSMQFLKNGLMLVGLPMYDIGNGKIGLLNYESFKDKWTLETHSDYTVFNKTDKYLGYSVISANVGGGVLYAAGEPRGHELKGLVVIYDPRSNRRSSLTGEQFGSYFGGTLLAEDIDGDGNDELFIAAPTFSKDQSYDNGAVFVYPYNRQLRTFDSKPIATLEGIQSGSRFGTCLSKLGDIDLDGFQDIAIAAPYEDDGTGAVYVYKGSDKGLVLSQRISPKQFQPAVGTVKGFGQGLSNGNDIDKNGHNDFTIGAYQSNKIFVVKSKPVVVIRKSMQTNLKTVTDQTTGFTVKYCMQFKQRSVGGVLKTLSFKWQLQLDYRLTTTQPREKTVLLYENREQCLDIPVQLSMKNIADLNPIRLSASVALDAPNIILDTSFDNSTLFLPISHNCGDDNVCRPLLSLNVVANVQKIVLGRDKILEVTITVKNIKEPALNSKLNIKKPSEIDLKSVGQCNDDNDAIDCSLGNSFTGTKTITISFNVDRLDPSFNNISIHFNLTSVSKPEAGSVLIFNLILPVVLENEPFIEGESLPDTIDLDSDSDQLKFVQKYTIGNSGPSPLKLEVDIYTPEIDGIVTIKESQIKKNDGSVQCTSVDDSYPDFTISDTHRANQTIFVNCKEETCVHLVCSYGYLGPSERADVLLTYNVKVKDLESKFRTTFLTHDLISFLSFAQIGSEEKQISTNIYGFQKKSIPTWIYIVAAVIGLLLLFLVIFGLYKCHFFNRMYKEKLQEEKLLDGEQCTSATDAVRMSSIEECELPDPLEDVDMEKGDAPH